MLAGVLLPLWILLQQAMAGDESAFLFRTLTAERLWRTLRLAFVVVLWVTVLALPAAWLLTRTHLPARRFLTILAVLPLAVPGYVMATAALDFGGYQGFTDRVFGQRLSTISGFTGAAGVLTLYTYPYMLLTLRTAFLGLDPTRVEAARTLGASPARAFRTAVLPQLLAGWSAGALLVALHVVGDFGVASLMRYETLGVAVETAYASALGTGDARYAYPAGMGLILLLVSVVFVVGDLWIVRRESARRAGARVVRRAARRRLGPWVAPAILFLLIVPFFGVGMPLAMIVEWLDDPPTGTHGLGRVLESVGNAVRASLPAALLGVALVFPLVLRSTRRGSAGARLMERAAFLGYATPRIVLGLAIYILALRLPDSILAHPRNTTVLLIVAYAIHFMAEAIGPLRTALLQVSPRLEEAARTLGLSRTAAFWRISVPLVARGVAVAVAFLFLACMKDLPLTLMLRPNGFDTPAWRVYSHANEAQFASAAPYALAILVTSALFIGLLIRREENEA